MLYSEIKTWELEHLKIFSYFFLLLLEGFLQYVNLLN